MTKIAIPTENGMLCQHFGHAPMMTFITIQDGKVIDKQTLPCPEHEHGSLPKFIAQNNATEVIAGGLGAGAIEWFNKFNITVNMGADVMEIDDLIKKYIAGEIVFSGSACQGHNDEEGHNCHHNL